MRLLIGRFPCLLRQRFIFRDALGAINIGLAIMPIIAFLSLISLGKNFAKKNHYQVRGYLIRGHIDMGIAT